MLAPAQDTSAWATTGASCWEAFTSIMLGSIAVILASAAVGLLLALWQAPACNRVKHVLSPAATHKGYSRHL